MIAAEGIECKWVTVVDNNSIHREVHHYKPTHCFIEALWVVPEKFDELAPLCPDVTWIVRGHSEVPFYAQEGVAMEWILQYIKHPQVYFAANSEAAYKDILALAISSGVSVNKVLYLPNFYPQTEEQKRVKVPDEFLDVACFGAIRPLKNQLIQAIAAIQVAENLKKTLRFHVNGTRSEQGGDPVVRNIRAVFNFTPHQLVEHNWMEHKQFKEVLGKMDLGLQVSFSETFNIVAADMVVAGLPIVVSPEIVWTSPQCQAEPTNTADIVDKAMKALDGHSDHTTTQVLNLRGLKRYCEASKSKWLQYLAGK